MVIKGFELVNDNKVNIVLNGDGNSFDGIGEDAAEEQILAEYDKRGGLIKKDGRKLKTGCFFDFKMKKPREKAVVEFDEGPSARPGTVVEKTDGPGNKNGRKAGAKKPVAKKPVRK